MPTSFNILKSSFQILNTKRVILLVLLILIWNKGSTQVLQKYKSGRNYYAELKKDSAHVEVYSVNHYFTSKLNEEWLLKVNKGDTLFAGQQFAILKKAGNYTLICLQTKTSKSKKIPLESGLANYLDSYRKKAFVQDKIWQLRHLSDSLSGPSEKIEVEFNVFRRQFDSKNLPFDEYIKAVNKSYDSIAGSITLAKNPFIDAFYLQVDSLSSLDSTKIYKLLQQSDYSMFYAKYLIRQLAKQKPALLIHYVDKQAANKKAILLAIRQHPNLKEITVNVKSCPIKSQGKKQIVKQKRIKTLNEIAVGAFGASIILAEIGLIVGLVVLIAR